MTDDALMARDGQALTAEAVETLVRDQMREWWDEICYDTNCHPLDIQRDGRKLWYVRSHWTDAVAKGVALEIASRLASSALLNGEEVLADLEAIREVVREAWNACDDSSDDFRPGESIAIPEDSFQALCAALAAVEERIPESYQPARAGVLVTKVIDALHPSPSRVTAPGRDQVALVIDPDAFRDPWNAGAQCVALDKAAAIIALFERGR